MSWGVSSQAVSAYKVAQSRVTYRLPQLIPIFGKACKVCHFCTIASVMKRPLLSWIYWKALTCNLCSFALSNRNIMSIISNHTKINCLCGLVEDAELAVVPLVVVDLKQGVDAGDGEPGHQFPGSEALELC